MLNLLLPHERNVVSVEGDVQAKLREESEALGIGRHRAKTKLVLAPAITDPLQALYFCFYSPLRSESPLLRSSSGFFLFIGGTRVIEITNAMNPQTAASPHVDMSQAGSGFDLRDVDFMSCLSGMEGSILSANCRFHIIVAAANCG